MVELLFNELARLPEVEAIALGGSRAEKNFDEKSDYDVYVYCTKGISESARRNLLAAFCEKIETGNRFWEYEDNCTLIGGPDIDIIYRNLDAFLEGVSAVAENFRAYNGYTTCLWHNLLTCKIIYDPLGRLAFAKKRFSIPFPEQLKKNIIDRNFKLLHEAMPAYDNQIIKALKRNDKVSVNHRVAAFLESYFDIIFALNGQTHPGEKRLISLCKQNCEILPANFEENLTNLFSHMFVSSKFTETDLKKIIEELEKIIRPDGQGEKENS